MNKFLRSLALTIPCLTALAFSPYTSLSFEIPKVFIFSFLLGILLITSGIQIWRKNKIEFVTPPKIVWIPLLVFVGFTMISTLLSEDFYTAFFGSHFRLQGLITHLAYFLWFGILLFLFSEKTFQKKFTHTLVILGAAVSTFALLNMFFPNLLNFWNEGSFYGRLFFPLGHPNFLAAFLLLTLPFTGLYLTQSKQKILASLPLLLNLGVLLLTQSRSALIGMWLGFIILAALFKSFRQYKILLASWILLPLLAFAAINSFPHYIVDTPLERLIVSETHTRSVSSRDILHDMGTELIKEKPLLGHGLDTQRSFTPRVIQPKIFFYERFQDFPDRFHSLPLDLLFQVGIFGTLAFLLFLIALFWQSRKQPNPILLATIFALTSYTITLCFGFATTADSILFWSLLALACAQFSETKNINYKNLLGATVIIFGLVITIMSIQMLRADLHFTRGKITAAAGEKITATNETKRATELNPFNAHYRETLIDTLFQAEAFEIARQEIKVAQQLFPQHFQFILQEAQLATALGNFEQADTAFSTAAKLAPYSFDIWWRWGQKEVFAGDNDQACRNWGRIFEFAPTYWSWTNLEDKTSYQSEKYRIFFQENPDFEVFLEDFQKNCGVHLFQDLLLFNRPENK